MIGPVLKVAMLAWLLSWGLQSSTAFGADLSLGIAAIEEGDDRLRPGTAFRLTAWDSFVANVYGWGRTLGPYTERSYLGNAGAHFVKSGNKTGFFAGAGFAILAEQSIYEARAEDGRTNANKTQFNAGGSLSVGYAWVGKSFCAQVVWDANLFPAAESSILLVFARKQALSLSAGVPL